MIHALRRYAHARRARREALAHLPGDFGLHHVCREARRTLPAWHPRRVQWLPVPRPSFDLPLRFS